MNEEQMEIAADAPPPEAPNEHCQRCDKNADDTAANGREQTKAKEALDRYLAGPGKIAKRWEERIEPAKKTLERLEKQWKA